jgi:hypothetical protein
VTGAASGCGSSDGGGTPHVDSDLLGIYLVDLFQTSPECGELMDAESTPRLVLYSVPRNDAPEEAILAGQFCGSVEDCRARVEVLPGAVNYSFFEGNDAEGWVGYGIARTGFSGDQCAVEVQVHTLSSTSDQSIEIDTREVETIYKPTVEGTTATCGIEDAFGAIMDDSPCTGLFRLEATFETNL